MGDCGEEWKSRRERHRLGVLSAHHALVGPESECPSASRTHHRLHRSGGITITGPAGHLVVTDADGKPSPSETEGPTNVTERSAGITIRRRRSHG